MNALGARARDLLAEIVDIIGPLRDEIMRASDDAALDELAERVGRVREVAKSP